MLDQTVDNNQLPLRTYENDVFFEQQWVLQDIQMLR